MRLLVVEDEPRVAAAIARGLRRHGAAVDVAPDGADALSHARVHPYDVVVLDRDLPEVHGDDVCRVLHSEHPGTKILMLTAAAETSDIVSGLALGADDYLAKPFRFDELSPASTRSHGGPVTPGRRSCARPTSSSTPPAAPCGATDGISTSARRSSGCSRR